MKKFVKLVMIIVLVMASGCTIPKMVYQILRNKNIDIQASDEVIDFFENIYHKNGKNR